MKEYVSYLILFVIFSTCCNHQSPSLSEAEKKVQPKNTLRIFIENDSTIRIAEDTLAVDEIREYIANQPDLDEVHIHAEPETKMTIVYDLESIFAEFSILRLYYHALGDSLLARYQPPPVYPNNAVIFTLSKDDIMMLGKDTLSNSEDLYPILMDRLSGQENPSVLLSTEEGTSYNYYLDQEAKIKSALARIDTSLRLEMAVGQGSYKTE
jgi:hypothetical protein